MDTRRWLNLLGIGMLIVLSAQGKIFIVSTSYTLLGLLMYTYPRHHPKPQWQNGVCKPRAIIGGGRMKWMSCAIPMLGMGELSPKTFVVIEPQSKCSCTLSINPLKVSAIFARVDQPILWRRDGSHDTIMVMFNGSQRQVRKNRAIAASSAPTIVWAIT